ncbi:MAG: homoserine O-acetyltransferase, partial [Phycisphaerae bacterium]|nr:homoserine O-acetyltransferase [Phycisphaerae bacterium]
MSDNFFYSSDTRRSGRPLKYLQTITFDQPLKLERGGLIEKVTVVFETYGTLDQDRGNAVL